MSSFSRHIKRFLGLSRVPIKRARHSGLTVEVFEDRITPTAFPTPLTQFAPAGSLMYGGAVADSISIPGEVDSYTIDLDAGQKLSIGMFPSATLKGDIQIFDPNFVLVGSGFSAAPGLPAAAQNVPVTTPGTYTINFTGQAGTIGNYNVQLGLNIQAEAELPTTTSNNSIGTAEDINGSFISLGGGASRGAVFGTTDPLPPVYTAAAIAPSFPSIVGQPGTVVSVNGDDVAVALTPAQLNGFSFPIYGTTFSSLNFNTNGLVYFGGTLTAAEGRNNTNLSNGIGASNLAGIAVLWDDLNFTPANSGQTFYQVAGSGPTQTLTIEWRNGIRFGSADPVFSFQAILSANGNIQFNYGNNITPAVLNTSTVGLKAAGALNPPRTLLDFNGNLTPPPPGALVGSNQSTLLTLPLPPDTYAVQFVSGQKNTAAVAGAGVSVNLLDGSGTLLQAGAAGATNVSSSITNFSVPTTGTYYLQITGPANTQYSLVATRNAAFDLEANDSIATARNIAGTEGVLGSMTTAVTSPYFASAVPLAFDDIGATGATIVGLSGDDASVSIPIGFSFPFYGVNYGDVFVSTNGLLTFGSANTAFTNTDLTSAPTQAAIAALWDDLNVTGTPNSKVVTQVFDTGLPTQRLVIQWNDISYLSPTTGGLTFQVVLNLDGSILLNYPDLAAGSAAQDEGISATVGVKDVGAQGVNRLLASFNTPQPNPLLGTGKSLLIARKGIDVYAIRLDPTQGGITASTSTPSDGPGEFVNTLDPRIVLRDSTGALITAGTTNVDGRNESLFNTLLTPGATYYIEVTAEGGTGGEYFLSYAATPAASSSTFLTASPNPTSAGIPVTFTATVTPALGDFGSVTFFDNGIALAGGSNVAISGGVAAFTISSLTAGLHPITAVYSGGGGVAGSTSNQVDEVIDAGAPTSTTIVSSAPNPSSISQSIAFTVTVAGGAATDGEHITLTDASNGNIIVPTDDVPLAGGSTVLTVAAGVLSIGTHNIVAHYAGSPSNLPSDSVAFVQTVTRNPTATTLSNTYSASAATPTFEDISGTGTATGLAGTDDGVVAIPLGFTLSLYGTSYTSVFVGSNGVLSFDSSPSGGSGVSSFTNASLLTGAPDQLVVAPYWDDLHISGGANSNVFTQALDVGTANERFVVQWNDVSYFTGTRAGGVTFEAVLFSANGAVQFNYLNMETAQPGGAPAGISATVGIKAHSPSTQALELDFNGAPASYAVFVGNNLSTLLSYGGPRDHNDPAPITYVVTVSGAPTDGETVVIRDFNHGNAVVPFTGGPLAGGTMTIQVFPSDFPANSMPTDTHNLVASYAGTTSNAPSDSAVLGQVLLTNLSTTRTWTGAFDTSWATPQNWAEGTAPVNGDTLIFSGAGAQNFININNTPAGNNYTLQFTATAPSYTIIGNAIGLNNPGAGISSASTATIAINVPLFTDSSASIDISAGTVILANTISGPGGLTKTGAGTLTLLGGNTYLGTTIISGGTLIAGAGLALGNGPAGAAVNNGGTLALAASGGVSLPASLPIALSGAGANGAGALENLGGNNSVGGPITLLSATVGIGADAGTLFLPGAIAGPGGITKVGLGTVVLQSDNSFQGATTINAGILVASASLAFGTSMEGLTVNNGGAVALANSGGITLPSYMPIALSGTGPTGKGALENISGNNIVGGPITLVSSTVSIGVDAGALVLPNTIVGPGGLTKVGPGRVILQGANNYLGATAIHAGTVVVGNSFAFSDGNASVTVNDGGAIALSGAGGISLPVAKPIFLSGAGPTGGGALESFGGANAVLGPISLVGAAASIIVDAGTLSLDGPFSQNSTELLIGGVGNAVVTGAISGPNGGAADINKVGAGTLRLAGNNTYEGSTSVAGGTLIAANNNALGAANGLPSSGTTVAAGAAVALTGNVIIPEQFTISGNGPGGLAAGAIVNLSGVNTLLGSVAAPTVPLQAALQNAAALYSEPSREVANAIDGDPFFTGWGNGGNPSGGNTAVFETASTLNPSGRSTTYTITITSGGFGHQTLGRFRLSLTNDNRNNFADGQANNGQLGNTWFPFSSFIITSDNGAAVSVNPDGSILVADSPSEFATYIITAVSSIANITGFRLEAIPDVGLPGGGPGYGAGGSFIVGDFKVSTDIAASGTIGSTSGVLVVASDLSNAAPWQFTVSGSGEVDINGTFVNDDVTLVKKGAGLLKINGNNTHTGTLIVESGSIGGSGRVFDLNLVGGTLAPGSSPGKLESGDLNMYTGSNMNVDLDGTVVETEYDQVDVTGSVNLDYDVMGGATLNVSVGYIPTNGDTYTILNNDSTDLIVGNFFGLAEGATFMAGGYTFQITYQGGADSNDVVLTAMLSGTLTLNPPTLPAGTVAVAYPQSLVASGGTGPYSYSVTAGSLPSGLSLSPSGNITGTPDTAGPYTFTVTATDSLSATGSQGYSVLIAPTATTTTLVALPLASTGGMSVMFTATIAPNPGNTGMVTFNDNASPIPGGSNIAVVGGIAVFSTSILTIGGHPITADYSGTANFLPSTSNTENVVVSGADTTTVLTDLGPSPSLLSQNVSFTVTVSGGTSTDGETVDIKDVNHGNIIVASGTLAGGSASLTVLAGALVLGSHDLVAVYAGNSYNEDSVSNPATVHIVTTIPSVVDIAINGDDIPSLMGMQRSRVASIKVIFSQAVDLDAGAISIALHTNNVEFFNVPAPSGVGEIPTLDLITSDNITWYVHFSGDTDDGEDGYNSIRDGVYALNITASGVHPAGAPLINMQTSSQKVFHRLYGDTDGAGTPGGGIEGVDFLTLVSVADNFAFRSAFNNLANYQTYLDFDGDANITVADNFQFRSRFNKILKWKVTPP